MNSQPIDPATGIGHVHLKVADLDRALGFYQGVLGFDVTQRFGRSAAFLSAGGYHHHIGLNTWESAGGEPTAERVWTHAPMFCCYNRRGEIVFGECRVPGGPRGLQNRRHPSPGEVGSIPTLSVFGKPKTEQWRR